MPLVVLDGDHRFEGARSRTRRLAELTGRLDAGRALVTRLQQEWEATRERVAQLASAGKTMPRVLFVLSHSMGQVRWRAAKPVLTR